MHEARTVPQHAMFRKLRKKIVASRNACHCLPSWVTTSLTKSNMTVRVPESSSKESVDSRIARSTFPIYRSERRGTPAAIGSAVLLQIGSAVFMCTAAHVLRAARGRKFLIPDGDTLQPFRPNPVVFLASPPSRRMLDLYDFAVERLNHTVISRLAFYRPVPLNEIDANELPDLRSLYEFVGYPASKNKSRRGKDLVVTTLGRYRCMPLQQDWYDRYGFKPNFHLLVAFGKTMTTPDGRTLDPGSPSGMSGGSVWRRPHVTRADGLSTADALVGIALERRRDALVALRISFVLEAIRYFHPDIAPLIPTSRWNTPTFDESLLQATAETARGLTTHGS